MQKIAATRLYDAAASRAIDAEAIARQGVTGYALMQRAADAAFACLLQQFPGAARVSVCCGKGNNAGDAYLVALRAHRFGIATRAIAAVDPAQLSGDAQHAYEDAIAGGVEVTTDDVPLEGDVIVDGLLGTGLNGAPRAPFDAWIEKVNAASIPVLSIDIPSGISADTGAAFGAAVRAEVTISFITRKIGLYTGDGKSYAGRLAFDDLGVSPEMYVADGVPLMRWDPGVLPALDANTYKHRQGHVAVVGGDVSMPGAVAMAAAAALRVGAGMVTAITRAEHAPVIVGRTPEVMVVPYAQSGEAASVPDPANVLERADLLVLGPGLGRSAWSAALYGLAERANKPTVLDADGLYWLAEADGSWRGGPLCITPHIAEAARLLDQPAAEVQRDRLGAAQALADRFQCQGVLKGAGSVVFGADGLSICAHGNPGMATAGMGDVLSGILGGLLVTRSDPLDIAAGIAAGVALHSAAADRAAARTGQRSLVATDVTAELPALLSGAPDA